MKCLECGDKGEAKTPEYQPTFCSAECVFAFAMRASSQYGRCEEHGKWFDVDFGCKACEDDESLEKMKQQRDELDQRIKSIESGECSV